MYDLSSALDVVWRSSGPRLAVARGVVKHLEPVALMQLVTFDVVMLLDLRPTSVVVDGDARSATLDGGERDVELRLVRYASEAFVQYEEGVNVAVSVRTEASSRRSLAVVLAAMQVARDHSDTMAFMPAELRDGRMLGFAEETGMENEQFRRLVAQFPILWRAL